MNEFQSVNQRQLELIDSIIFIIKCWKSTNDISSPTHYGDIVAELLKYSSDVDSVVLDDIIEAVSDLLTQIKYVN